MSTGTKAPAQYEAVKIYDADYDRAKAIRGDRGLPLVECVGCALEGWARLPRKVQDQVIRDRARRQHPEPAAAVA